MKARKKNLARTSTFEIVVEGSRVHVKATPYLLNNETRFRVSYNDSPVHIFSYNPEIGSMRLIEENKAEMPAPIERAIIHTLTHQAAA